MRCAALLVSAIGALATVGAAAAQQSVRQIDPRALQRLQAQPAQSQQSEFDSGAGYRLNPDNGLWYGWVNFDQDRAAGRIAGARANLAWHDEAGGVRFSGGGRGDARIVRCGSSSNTCAPAQPDSPDALTGGGPSGPLRLDFARPVLAVTLLLSPDRSVRARPDLFVMEGWRNGDVAAITRAEVQSTDNASRGWSRLTLSSRASDVRAATAAPTAGSGEAFDFVIVRGLTANGSETSGPIMMDGLRFVDQHGPTPYDSLGPRAGGLETMLADTERRAQRLQAESRRELVHEGGRRDGLAYPAAERMRMPVDMAGAQAACYRQRDGLRLDIPSAYGFPAHEAVTLPVLAPLSIFRNEDPGAGLAERVRFTGHSDYFHLRFDSALGRVVISGTRIVVPSRPGTLEPGQIQISSGYDGAYASFNLYGASYSVRVACGVEEIDAPCNDAETLRALLERLFLWMPEET